MRKNQIIYRVAGHNTGNNGPILSNRASAALSAMSGRDWNDFAGIKCSHSGKLLLMHAVHRHVLDPAVLVVRSTATQSPLRRSCSRPTIKRTNKSAGVFVTHQTGDLQHGDIGALQKLQTQRHPYPVKFLPESGSLGFQSATQRMRFHPHDLSRFPGRPDAFQQTPLQLLGQCINQLQSSHEDDGKGDGQVVYLFNCLRPWLGYGVPKQAQGSTPCLLSNAGTFTRTPTRKLRSLLPGSSGFAVIDWTYASHV